MRNADIVKGYSYELKPVGMEDAQTILDIRLEDREKNRYIHEIADDLDQQRAWIRNYLERENEYYFVIKNVFTDQAEGLISLYGITGNEGEWGRWVIKKGSLCSLESVLLIFQFGFEICGLSRIFSRTIEENRKAVKFHETIGQKFSRVICDYAELSGAKYNVVEHYTERDFFRGAMKGNLEQKSIPLFLSNFRRYVGPIEFHHLGVCSKDFELDRLQFKLLGYQEESALFTDELQGIRGLFLTNKSAPRIELLENLSPEGPLTVMMKKGIKIYHMAFLCNELEKTAELFSRVGAILISPVKDSVYFKGKICFLTLKNRLIIELIEQRRQVLY